MKLNKYLLIAFVVTILTAVNGVYAFSAFSGFYDIDESIPAYNGSKSITMTGSQILSVSNYGYQGQAIADVSINPSYDTLDARMTYKSSSSSPSVSFDWQILENGKDTIMATGTVFGFPSSNFEYKITIDSRWYYTKATSVKGTWGFYNA